MSKKPTVREGKPLTEEEEGIEKHNVSYLTLLRFMRGYKDDVNPSAKSIDMLGKMLAWRDVSGADDLGAAVLDRHSEYKRMWPHGMHGFGKDGNLVYVDRVGSVEPSKLMHKTSGFNMDEVKRFHIQMMERVNSTKDEAFAATGQVKYKSIVILDLAGLGMSHMGSKFTGPMKSFIQIDQEYYPESLFMMVIIGAGIMVKSLWALISPFIDPLTKERIKFGEKHLFDIMDAEQIPAFIKGGKCKCEGGKCLQTEFRSGYTPEQLAERKKRDEERRVNGDNTPSHGARPAGDRTPSHNTRMSAASVSSSSFDPTRASSSSDAVPYNGPASAATTASSSTDASNDVSPTTTATTPTNKAAPTSSSSSSSSVPASAATSSSSSSSSAPAPAPVSSTSSSASSSSAPPAAATSAAPATSAATA